MSFEDRISQAFKALIPDDDRDFATTLNDRFSGFLGAVCAILSIPVIMYMVIGWVPFGQAVCSLKNCDPIGLGGYIKLAAMFNAIAIPFVLSRAALIMSRYGFAHFGHAAKLTVFSLFFIAFDALVRGTAAAIVSNFVGINAYGGYLIIPWLLVSFFSFLLFVYFIGYEHERSATLSLLNGALDEIKMLRSHIARQDATILDLTRKLQSAGDIEAKNQHLQALIVSAQNERARLQSIEEKSAAEQRGRNRADLEHEREIEKIIDRQVKKQAALERAEKKKQAESLKNVFDNVEDLLKR